MYSKCVLHCALCNYQRKKRDYKRENHFRCISNIWESINKKQSKLCWWFFDPPPPPPIGQCPKLSSFLLFYCEPVLTSKPASATVLWSLRFGGNGANQTSSSPNWEGFTEINQLFIKLLLLEADIYLNLFQGSIAKLQYCIIKVLQISSNLDP